MASDAKVEDKPADKAPESKTIAQGEDDEFEDFPVDGASACFLDIKQGPREEAMKADR